MLPGHWLEHIRPNFGVERSWRLPAACRGEDAAGLIELGSTVTADNLLAGKVSYLPHSGKGNLTDLPVSRRRCELHLAAVCESPARTRWWADQRFSQES